MSTTWHYGEPQDGILKVTIEQADKPVNSLAKQDLEELSKLLTHAESDPNIKGLLFTTGKEGNFIAGADVNQFKEVQGPQEAREISQFGHLVFQQLEDLSKPTVALISGSCLGGGLEFALCCDYRLADDRPKTLIGLPEVKLGIIPGWGGNVRLPRTIGLAAALPMILTGRMLNGRQAKSKGLVHDCIPREALQFAGEKILKAEMKSKGSAAKFLPQRKRPLWRKVAFENPLFYKLAFSQAEQQVRKTTHGHYPAPFKAIEVIRTGLSSPQAGFAAEADALAELSQSPVTAELIRLFFLSEDAKKPPESLEVPVDTDAIQEGAVLGAGAMGAGIALLMARKGIWTRLKDIKPEFVAGGMKTIRKLINSDVKRKKITELEATNALDHLSPTTDYTGLKHCDIVIEAVVEEMDVKRKVFDELAEATNDKTVLATNTSSLLVTEIARDVAHPERVVGLHFFNPPHQMPLVEVIRTEQTSPEALATAIALVQRLGKTKVVVGDCAGFLVNRLLAPYMNETGFLLLDVEDPMEIEKAAIAFGMPMGPLELTGLVGIEVAAHVAENMQAAYGDRFAPSPLWTHLGELAGKESVAGLKLVEKTRSGKQLNPKVAAAISDLRAKGSAGPPKALSREVITQRLVYPIINEAARCLAEQMVEKPEDIDLAMVFGTGFAPFRGGPLRYADSVGVSNIVLTLDQLAADFPRFTPSEELRRRAGEGIDFLEPFLERPAPAAV